MILLLINLLQAQRTRLSWVVIVGAALVLIVGVMLFVYFYRRYKKIEKEAEEDWDASRRSLFVNVAPEPKPGPTDSAASIEAGATQAVAAFTEETPVAKGATREFASEIEVPSTEPAKTITPEPIVEPIPPPVESPREVRPTELLASAPSTEPVLEPQAHPDDAGFDEDVWAGLDVDQPPPETSRIARVEGPSHRGSFEPPRVEHITHREPYTPPRIEPLTPREQAATRALHSMKPVDKERTEERTDRQTGVFGAQSPAPPVVSEPMQRAEREPREFAAEPVAAASRGVERAIASTPTYRSRVAPAGSVLGLPFEASRQPLILGDPVRPASETGIGALTNYGKDLGPKGGRAGTVVLLLVLVLLAGAAAVYQFVPSAHSRVNELVARIRGADGPPPSALKPKAQVIPSSRPEVNKNMVIARGAVDNISDAPLENLEIEVSLQRGGDAGPEIRRIPVTPNPLPPSERGLFEFEYDGKLGSGFAGYTITRLFSNGNEVKFKSPAQK